MDALLSRSGVRQRLAAFTRAKQPKVWRHSLRSYSEVNKEKETEDLMEQLLQQHLEKEERTILPYHASEHVLPSVEKDDIPYPEEVSVVSGVSEWSAGRKIQIFKPARHQMQSGTYNTRHWEIHFDSPKTWENPLMKWTSTDDPFHSVVLKFDTKEEAIMFARKQKWEFQIEEPSPTGDFEGQLSYSHNFLPLDVENKIKREGKKSHVHFRHPTGRQSNWVKALKYHGEGEVEQHGGEKSE